MTGKCYEGASVDDQALIDAVHQDLRAIRATKKVFQPHEVRDYPGLSVMQSALGDDFDLWMWIREIGNEQAHRSREVEAAMYSLFNTHTTVLDRLEHVGEKMMIDQRHARRLGDDGMKLLARALVESWRLSRAPLESSYLLQFAWITAGDERRNALFVNWRNKFPMQGDVLTLVYGTGEAEATFRIAWEDFWGDSEWRFFTFALPPLEPDGFPPVALCFPPRSAPAFQILHHGKVGERFVTSVVFRSTITFYFVTREELEAEVDDHDLPATDLAGVLVPGANVTF